MPYVKTSARTTRAGTVRYLQLAHNEWDPETQRSRTRILHNFGREDEIDKDQVRRLVSALSRLLDPAEALAASEPGELSVTASRPVGGTYALDRLWRMLRLDDVIGRCLAGRPIRAAGRTRPPSGCCSPWSRTGRWPRHPSSPPADWVASDVHIDGLDEVTDDACYRAMDQLLAIGPDLAEQAYYQVTDLLNLEVDLLFFDTTSTYFETEEADEDVPRDERGECVPAAARRKQARPGSAPTATPRTPGTTSRRSSWGWPSPATGYRCGCGPGPGTPPTPGLSARSRRTCATGSVEIIWVADRGFTSEKNRRALMRGGGGYIIGEKLRSGSPDVKAALSRQGRYKTVRDNLQVKEVRLGDDTDRFIICHNPDQAGRDAAIRARLVAQLEELISGTDSLTASERAKLEGSLAGKPGLKRFLRVTPAAAAGGQGEGQGRGEPRRQVSPAHLRPAHDDRGHRARLQAAPRSRARLEGHEAGHRPAPGLPPARGPHPRPRHPLLARPPPDPRRREHRRAPLGTDPRRAPAPARRHLDRPRRHLPPGHRPHQAPAGHLHRTQYRTAEEDPRPGARGLSLLTCTNITA